MDLKQVKQIIRKSVNRQIREITMKQPGPPSSFEDFRKMLSNALSIANAPDGIVEAVQSFNESNEDNAIYGMIWDTWNDIITELTGIENRVELLNSWDELLKYYIPSLITNVAEEYIRISKDQSLFDVEMLALDTVAAMK